MTSLRNIQYCTIGISLLILFQIYLFLLYSSYTFCIFTFAPSNNISPNRSFPGAQPIKSPKIVQTTQNSNTPEQLLPLVQTLKSKNKYLLPEYESLLKNNENNFFLIEPFLLSHELRSELNDEDEYEEFIWRFDLPQEFRWKRNSLTVGLMAADLENRKNNYLKNISPDIQIVFGSKGPFDNSNDSITHLFYRIPSDESPFEVLHLHVVIFYPVKHFFWIDRIPASLQFTLTDREQHTLGASFNIEYFGSKTEQIFDSFDLATNDREIALPDDARHFLSQITTSEYIHCPVERREKWFRENNQTINFALEHDFDKAIVNFKAFTRRLEMQFWMACGTLLGWYRQCHITPFTKDLDFISWPKYLKGIDRTAEYRTLSPQYNLRIVRKFGEPTSTMEYTFWSMPESAQIDLFFMYRNESHFFITTHTPPVYWYSAYPKYSLCSGELLGHKVLVPCEPLAVIEAEYTRNWSQPQTNWNYFHTSPILHKMGTYPFNNSQMEEFD